jgi:uncharacterized DUF497 family protein
MKLIGIEWDENKNVKNKRDHGVSIEDAQFIFTDPERIERIDQSVSNISKEERWQTIGKVGSVYFVVYAEQINGLLQRVRRISRSNNGYYQIDGKGWGKTT